MAVAYPQPGERIGAYRIERPLGGGGMGQVYVGLDEALDRRVAVKVISADLADDPEFRERFGREARALAALDSANVVQVYAAGESRGRLYIATQLMPDGDLGALLRERGGLPLPEAIGVVEDVGAGLADAHEAGIVHRDIKPANVLLRRRGGRLVAALADFGIARRTGSQLTLTHGQAIGTTGYMAPELHRGEPATEASDIYALGCLLWTALTGVPPYVGETDYQVIMGHLQGRVPQLADAGLAGAPAALTVDRVLARSMAKDPRNRYPRVRDLLADMHDLPAVAAPAEAQAQKQAQKKAQEQASKGVDGQARRPLGVAESPETARRRREGVLVAALMLLALLLLGTVALLWLRGHGDNGPDRVARESRGSSTSTSGSTPSRPPQRPPTPTGLPTGGSAPSTGSTPQVGPVPLSQRPRPPYDATDRRSARAGLVSAYRAQPLVKAPCMARAMLSGFGLRGLVSEGMFDRSWTFHDKDISAFTAWHRSVITTAALSCAATG